METKISILFFAVHLLTIGFYHYVVLGLTYLLVEEDFNIHLSALRIVLGCIVMLCSLYAQQVATTKSFQNQKRLFMPCDYFSKTRLRKYLGLLIMTVLQAVNSSVFAVVFVKLSKLNRTLLVFEEFVLIIKLTIDLLGSLCIAQHIYAIVWTNQRMVLLDERWYQAIIPNYRKRCDFISAIV
ncbi:hypothetical protein ACOME3_007049 [Neoechinorhynchus agilis]